LHTVSIILARLQHNDDREMLGALVVVHLASILDQRHIKRKLGRLHVLLPQRLLKLDGLRLDLILRLK